MANNIKIVGSILDTSKISRYDAKDINLISSQKIAENFGGEGDYIEYYTYDIAGNLLDINYDYLSYKLPSDIGLTPGTSNPPNTTGNIQTTDVGIDSTLASPTSSLYPIIEIDPVQDLQDIGYSSGEFNVRYNIFHNKLSNFQDKALFVKEISQDRTEIRLASTTLTNDEIESTVLSIIDEINNSPYFVDYLLNFGVNNQYVAVNVALNKAPEGYEVLFKLYQPLPLTIQEKQTLWIVEEKTTPYVFDINLDKLIIAAPAQQLRGPNFGIEIPNQSTVSTQYNTYSNLVTGLQSLQQTSYHQILNLLATQSVNINIDYTDFNNFVFFGSAYQRVTNFYTKAQQIEDYNNFISANSSLTSSTPSLITEINTYSSSVSTIISQFDGYESYLYFESSSYAWPKSGSAKPFSLLSTGSAAVLSWYPALTSSAQTYDETNYDNLEYAVPTFIKDDDTNSPFLLFLNMIGHYFDNIWIYLGAVTDVNLANNNLNYGISRDLVYNQLQSLGIKLYNSQAGESVDQFLIGANTGSSIWDNNTTITGSYLNNIPRKDLVSELYKRIYHNLPLLLKTKGTVAGLDHLTTIFGITGSILNVKEFGGSLKSNLINGYNNDKVRIVDNSIAGHPSGSVLSPFLSLQTFPVTSSQFRDNDMNYVDISFSPQTQIDTYISGAIASNNPSWSLDDYIGDPRQQYSGSYPDLDTQRKLYFGTGVSGFPPFTGSLMDYNGFIRLIQYFDNALFKMLNDFVPERTSLSTGVTFNSPVLERNKAVYANPSNSTTQSVYDAEYSASTISSQYGTFYNSLSSSNNTMGWFDGELSGSIVNVNQYFLDNPNPYLGDWNVWNAQHSATQSINANSFAHSEWNVLLNNVSKSVVSTRRKKIEYTGNYLPTGSITSSAELQDSYLTLRSYNTSRYEGSKTTSLKYNTYTSSSYTGSDGKIQVGDKSYGKTAAIDRQSYKVGWVKNIPSQSLNFSDKTQIQLKYLVDASQNLTDLTLKNNNLFEVQNTFKSGDNVVLSLSDAIKPSFQKTLDGTKTIFRGGYSFDPILFRENNETLYFRSLTPLSSSKAYAGLKSYGLDFYSFTNTGDSIYKNAVDHGIGSSPIDPSVSLDTYNVFGVSYFINYDGRFKNKTDFPTIGQSAASQAYSKTDWNAYLIQISQQNNSKIKWDLTATGYIECPGGNIPASGPNGFDVSDGVKYAYIFDQIKFNYTSSFYGAYNIEDTDVIGNGQYLFQAPRNSDSYNIKLKVPIFINVEYFKGDNNDWIYYSGNGSTNNNKGFSFKIFGILESAINPTSTTRWTYRGSTSISTQVGSSIQGQNGPVGNANIGLLHWDGTNAQSGPGNELSIPNPYTNNFAGVLTLSSDTSSTEEITISLQKGEILRFRVVLLDIDRFFTYGRDYRIEIGKPQLPPSVSPFIKTLTGFSPSAISDIPPASFEIKDLNYQKTLYKYDTIITGSTVFFQTSDNSINFIDDVITVLATSSLFQPTAPTSNYYSPVTDILSIQENDLIRLSSFNSPTPDYYTVVTASLSSSPILLTASASFNPRFSYQGGLYNMIQLKNTADTRNFFNTIWNSTSKQFTISNISGVTNPLTMYAAPIYITIDFNDVNTNPPILYNFIRILVSSRTLTTPPAYIPLQGYWGIDINNNLRLYSDFNQTIISTNLPTFTESNPKLKFNCVLDRSITLQAQLSQNFAILRPKPDETSVIINFKKSPGDVSQTILVPQDANNEIKSKVGTIFSSLNVDLSNTSQNLTQ